MHGEKERKRQFKVVNDSGKLSLIVSCSFVGLMVWHNSSCIVTTPAYFSFWTQTFFCACDAMLSGSFDTAAIDPIFVEFFSSPGLNFLTCK